MKREKGSSRCCPNPACPLSGQFDIRVDRKLLLGTQEDLEESLFHSEDSQTLNASFVERHNPTIRQGCSYLGRRTLSHARQRKSLEGQMALIMLYCNFIRPHMALKFGELVKTPAIQAGLASKRISFREVFTTLFILFFIAYFANIADWILAGLEKAIWKNHFIPTTTLP
jgi:hypothetical protein